MQRFCPKYSHFKVTNLRVIKQLIDEAFERRELLNGLNIVRNQNDAIVDRFGDARRENNVWQWPKASCTNLKTIQTSLKLAFSEAF